MIPRTSSSSAPSKRKKWTEEEERSLIEKYATMSADGSLSRLRTRERRFRPIADHVNAVHHAADPAAFPFLWSWKDASTKVQNMRHQYLLVKQKLLSSSSSSAASAASAARPGSDCPDPATDLDLAHQGVSLWPNFLRYRDVFGDHPLPPKPQDPHDDCDGDGDLGLGLGFDADDDGFAYAATADAADVAPAPPKKRKKKRSATEEEEDEEWEERMEKKREEWRKKIEEMLSHHRAEMEGIQERILQDQQSMISQVLGLVSNWAAPLVVAGIPDGATAAGASLGNPNNNNNHHHHPHHHHNHQQYLSQMMQGLHQENGIAAEEGRAAAGEAPEDQFIVD